MDQPSDENSQEDVDKDFEAVARAHYDVILKLDVNNYDEKDETVKNAILHCKRTADFLRGCGYPLYTGESNCTNFNKDVRNQALMFEEFLDDLLSNEPDTLSGSALYHKLRILIAQGESFDDFRKIMAELDCSVKCTSIWENESVAYRCTTCALSPCMSLCADCFEKNGHAGHDYVRFFSKEGGACDCGNDEVLKPEGFCDRHGAHAAAARPSDDSQLLVSVSQYVVLKLFVKMLIKFRGLICDYNEANILEAANIRSIQHFADDRLEQNEGIIVFLQECACYGSPVRDTMARILLDQSLYSALTERNLEHLLSKPPANRIADLSLDWRLSDKFELDRKSLLDYRLVELFPQANVPSYTQCHCLQDELIFWVIRLSFPQNIVNLSLSMLTESDYAGAYASRFFTWYPLVVGMIRGCCNGDGDVQMNATEVHALSCRVVHVSVQMLSSAVLCEKLNKTCDLVNITLRSFYYVIIEPLFKTKVSLDPMNRWCRISDQLDGRIIDWDVVDIDDNNVLSKNGFWALLGDIQNILSHQNTAMGVVFREKLLNETYLKILSAVQGMCLTWRIVTGDHVEMDNLDRIHRAFTLEYELISSVVSNVVKAIAKHDNSRIAEWLTYHVTMTLEKYLTAISGDCTGDIKSCAAFNVTYHIPLHRHLSIALTQFAPSLLTERFIKALKTHDKALRLIILHPLRIQVAREECFAGMWVRNGNYPRMQNLYYTQPHIYSALQLADIDLVRFCAASLNKEWLVACLFESYHLFDVFVLEPLDQKLLTPRPPESLFGSCSSIFSSTPHSPSEGHLRGSDNLPLYVDEVDMLDDLVEEYMESHPDCSSKQIDMRLLLESARRSVPNEPGIPPLRVSPAMSISSGSSRSSSSSTLSKRRNGHPPFVKRQSPEEIRMKAYKDCVDYVGRCAGNHEKLWLSMTHILTDNVTYRFEDGDAEIVVPDDDELPTEDLRYLITQLHIVWSERDSMVLTRPEWVGNMMEGCLSLLTQLLVIRINCGATYEESIRTEVVHMLSEEPLTYSKLRSNIRERGTKAETDVLFDRILSEITHYVEPDLGGSSGQMRQGMYILKKQAWLKLFCPVMCKMRCTLRTRQKVLLEIQNVEKGTLAPELREQMNEVWTPYQLISFDRPQYESLTTVFDVLLSDRFMQLIILTIIESKRHEETEQQQNDALPLAVYLITLAVSYSSEPSFICKLYRKYSVVCPGGSRRRPFHSVFSVMMDLLNCSLKKNTKHPVPMLYRAILDGSYWKTRIIGGPIEYVARFFSRLCKIDTTCRSIFDACLWNVERTVVTVDSPKLSEDDEKAERKAIAKKRREALLAANKKKGSEVMQKLMSMEGMSQNDVDAINTDKPEVRLYDCPICGCNESPSTMKEPMGLLVKASANFIYELSLSDDIDSSVERNSVMDFDGGGGLTGQGPSGLRTIGLSKYFWRLPRNELKPEAPLNFYNDLTEGPFLASEVKACGHTAHMDCFNSYVSSRVNPLRVEAREEKAVPCPLCRCHVNCIIPIGNDWGFVAQSRGNIECNSELAFEMCANSIMNYKKDFPIAADETGYQNHYSVNLRELLQRVARLRADYHDGRDYNEQTTLVAVVKSQIECNMAFQSLKVPEHRRGTRRLPIPHLIPAVVAKTTRRDRDAALFVLQELLDPNTSGWTTSKPSHSIDDPMGEVLDEHDTSVEIGVDALLPEEMWALQSTPVRKKITLEPRVETYQNILLQQQRKDMASLLLFDQRSLLVRLCSFVLDNKNISSQDILQLCRALLRRILASNAVKACVMLLQRVSAHYIVQLALPREQSTNPFRRLLSNVAVALSKEASLFEAMCSHLGNGEDDIPILSETQILTYLKGNLQEFASFAIEFLCSAGVDTPDNLDSLDDVFNWLNTDAASCLIPDMPLLIRWIKDFYPTIGWNYRSGNQALSREPLTWRTSTLLDLPYEYDVVFGRYYKQPCVSCEKVPVCPMVCMRCARLVCTDTCCSLANVTEVERHSHSCCVDNGVFLALNNAVVVVTQGKMCGIWGAIYMDSHGEEDRNLKRGKPLFLSKKRLENLRHDWATAQWRLPLASWTNYQDLHNILRDPHGHAR